MSFQSKYLELSETPSQLSYIDKRKSNVTKRCYNSLLTINKLRDTLPRKTLVHLIQSLAFTHITYCLPAWAPPTQ